MVWHRNGTKDCQNLLKCSLYLDIRNKTENGNEKKNYFELIFYKHHDVYKSIINPYLNQHLKQISYHFHLLELSQSIFKKLLYIFCRKSQKLHSIKTRIFPLTFHLFLQTKTIRIFVVTQLTRGYYTITKRVTIKSSHENKTSCL